MDAYDVVILGGGSAGEYAASLLTDGGKRVAVVEERLVGGECPYFACMPSKAMLAAAELRHSITRSAVTAGAISRPLALDGDREAYAAAVTRRDVVSKRRDDAGAVRRLEDKGVRVIKTRGRIEGPGVLTADGSRIGWRDLVIATGAGFRKPPTWSTPFRPTARPTSRRSASSRDAGRPHRSERARSHRAFSQPYQGRVDGFRPAH